MLLRLAAGRTSERVYGVNSTANLVLRSASGSVRTSAVDVSCDIFTILATRNFAIAGGKKIRECDTA